MAVEPLTAVPPAPTRGRYPDAEGYVERDGVRVFYEVYGSGARTVLLLPTWSILHSRQWKGQIPSLARHFRVVTFDGRGNGRSDRPATPSAYDEAEFAADAVAVLDATATERAALVGYSLGAQRGLILAVEQPERVEGALFVGAAYPGGGRPLDERALQLGGRARDRRRVGEVQQALLAARLPGFRRLLLLAHLRRTPLDEADRGLRGLGARDDGRDARHRAARKDADAGGGARPRRPAALPAARRARDGDQIAHYSRGEALADHGGGRLLLVDGGGHAPHARDPVMFNRVLHDFLERLP